MATMILQKSVGKDQILEISCTPELEDIVTIRKTNECLQGAKDYKVYWGLSLPINQLETLLHCEDLLKKAFQHMESHLSESEY